MVSNALLPLTTKYQKQFDGRKAKESTPPPPPISALTTGTYVNFPISSSLYLSHIKREEFAPMTEPYVFHNDFLSSEELAVLNKSRSTVASINNVIMLKVNLNARA